MTGKIVLSLHIQRRFYDRRQVRTKEKLSGGKGAKKQRQKLLLSPVLAPIGKSSPHSRSRRAWKTTSALGGSGVCAKDAYTPFILLTINLTLFRIELYVTLSRNLYEHSYDPHMDVGGCMYDDRNKGGGVFAESGIGKLIKLNLSNPATRRAIYF